MPIVTEIYSREDIENKDKKIQELERDVCLLYTSDAADE